MPRIVAISGFVFPCATQKSTSASRGESLIDQKPIRDANNWAYAAHGALSNTIVPINYVTDYWNPDVASGCKVAPERYYRNYNLSEGFKSRHPGGARRQYLSTAHAPSRPGG